MSVAGKTLEVSLPCNELETQTLVVTVPNAYKEFILPQSSLSVLSKISTPFTEVKNSLHGSDIFLKHEMETEVASSCSP